MSYEIYDIKCPFWDQASLNSIKLKPKHHVLTTSKSCNYYVSTLRCYTGCYEFLCLCMLQKMKQITLLDMKPKKRGPKPKGSPAKSDAQKSPKKSPYKQPPLVLRLVTCLESQRLCSFWCFSFLRINFLKVGEEEHVPNQFAHRSKLKIQSNLTLRPLNPSFN